LSNAGSAWGPAMRRLSFAPQEPEYPTASEMRRAAECVAPWALGLREDVDEAGEWAEYGRRAHRIAEFLARGQLTMAIQEQDVFGAQVLAWAEVQDVLHCDREARKAGSGWHVEAGIKWRSDGLADEVALCERKPGERLRGWFAGTADLVYVRRDNVLVVVDWKFGPREHVTGEPAEDSCQGWFLALAFAELLGITASGPSVVVARFERRMVREDRIEVDAHDITQGELVAFAKALVGLAERITSAVGATPRLSAACGHCKAKAHCPSWEALEARVIGEMVDVHSGHVEALRGPPQNAADTRFLHYAIEQGEHLVEEWRRLRDAYVLTIAPVRLGLGLELRAIPQTRRSVVTTPEAMDLVEAVAGKDAIKVERSATCASIEQALAPKAKAEAEAETAHFTSASDRKKARAAIVARRIDEGFARLIEGGAVRESGRTHVVREVRASEEEE